MTILISPFFEFQQKKKKDFINFHFVFSLQFYSSHFLPYSLHSHPDSPHYHPSSYHSHLDSSHSNHVFLVFSPSSLHSHLYSLHFHPHFPDSSHSVPRFPILAFTDSRYSQFSEFFFSRFIISRGQNFNGISCCYLKFIFKNF